MAIAPSGLRSHFFCSNVSPQTNSIETEKILDKIEVIPVGGINFIK